MAKQKKQDLKAIVARVWYDVVSRRAGLNTPYAFEKHFWPSSFQRKDGEFHRPCKPDRYKRGERLPSIKTAQYVESRYPRTRGWLELLLWDVMYDRGWTEKKLAQLINNERPGLMHRLDPNTKRHNPHILTVDSLWRQGDIHALTVLLALLRYAKLTGRTRVHADAAHAAKHVFFYIAAGEPFYSVRREMFAYLKPRFFSERYSFVKRGRRESAKDAEATISTLRNVLAMADELRLIRYQPQYRAEFAYRSFRQGLSVVHLRLFNAFVNEVENPEHLHLWPDVSGRWDGVVNDAAVSRCALWPSSLLPEKR